MKRGTTWLLLGSIWLVLVGCSRHIVLQAMDEPGSAASYACGDKECTTTDEVNPENYNQAGTVVRALPSQCGENGIERILIMKADSKDPQVIVTCAAPRRRIGTMGGRG